ncbi:MAG TPA: TlpA disulfide reductase family protein [Pyrinomonadaceae bacterium]|jgi:thiol-disulfide isomerase/thioredoxin|nr:TlpA disulfide reductase family protein [Pyrinomonadaceae bacterium]
MTIASRFLRLFALLLTVAIAGQIATAQKRGKQKAPVGPPVTQIDLEGLKGLLKPNGKPRLINFWATWCDPCREEFPELVKVDAANKGKIDFVTVSLDDLADISTWVPKFLKEMNATMPAYLLHTVDESSAITTVSKDWNGDLPFTILIKPDGEVAYFKKGKIKSDIVSAEIGKLFPPAQ